MVQDNFLKNVRSLYSDVVGNIRFQKNYSRIFKKIKTLAKQAETYNQELPEVYKYMME